MIPLHRIGGFLALWLLPLAVWAAENPTPGSPAVEPLSMAYLAKLTVGLLVVLVAILLFGWLFRRSQGLGGLGGNRQLRVLATLSMGTRERIVILQAGEQQLVVAVTPGRIQTLHVLDEPIEFDSASSSHPFSKKLERFMHKDGA